MKQLWKSVGELKTPERRLLFGLMLAIIGVLWVSVRNNDSAKDVRIKQLEQIIIQKDQEKETQRILMQDKIDICKEENYENLKQMLDQTEELKNEIKNMK